MVETRSTTNTSIKRERLKSDPNPNAQWMSSWVVNLVLLVGVMFLFTVFPGLSNETSWTLTILSYNVITFVMFHGIIGTPFDYDQNEMGGYTLWEQIDSGDQFTPSKKFLTAVPILLFVISTHYSHYTLTLFSVNFVITSINVFVKLPLMDHVRIFGLNKGPED